MASCSNSRHYYMYRLALKQTTPASSEINTNKTNASYNNRPSRKPSDSPQVSEKYTSFHKRGGLPLPHRRQLNNKNNPAKGSTPTSGGGDDDTFLSQYIKSLEIQTTLNDHQLYSKALEKQRKVKSLEIYQRYLNANKKADYERNYKQYLSKNNTRLQRRDSVSQVEPIVKDVAATAEIKQQQQQQQQQQQHQHKNKQQDKETVLLDAQKKKASATHITHRLPVEFMDCPIDFLIDLISRMLQSLITLNDKSVPNSISNPPSAATTTTSSSSATTNGGSQSSNSLLTRYHSRTPPAISTLTYLSRLTKFNNFNPAILLTTIYYIDLLSHQYQPFFTLNSWTVHRFLLVGTMIAQKSLEDFFYTNDHYAKVGGVALGELNCLELDFLSRVDWRCIPGKQAVNKILGTVCTNIGEAKDVLNMYYFQLIDLMGKNSHSGGQIQRDEQQGQQPAVYYVRAGSIGVGEENALKEDGSSATSEVQDDDMLDDDDDDDEEEGEGEEEDESDYYDDDDDDDDEDDGGGDGDDDDEEEGNSNNNTMIHPTSDTDYKLHPNLTQIYDKNGFVINGSSSPHLKRRYSGS